MKKLADKRKKFRMSFVGMHFISKTILLLCIPFVGVIALLSALEEWFNLDFFSDLGFWFWSIVIVISVIIVVNLAIEYTRQQKMLKERYMDSEHVSEISIQSAEEEDRESLEKEVLFSSEKVARSNLKDKCIVCMDFIGEGDKYVTCPSCKIPAHTAHLIEWLNIKSVCPNCKKRIQGI
ncbi:MAG: E3 ubiquitin-protein ligase [Candidatus Cloacimonadota bacterium]|nr:MAG: E3 ubiquitin-protein ligase [Candidatus Cloacimonadota bacterium]